MIRGALKLAGGLLKNKGLMKGIRNEALVSGGLNTGVNLLTGADPITALAYGVADTVTSGAAQGAVRGIRGKKSRLELPANVAGSVLSGIPVAAIDPRMKEGVGAPMVPADAVINDNQAAQIEQQNIQRMLLNNNLLAGQYMPGTMFQQMGVNNTRATMQQYLNDKGPTVGMDPRAMASIVGL
mgnify:CR=1 FL=1|jgi:hypothetical protein